MFRDYDDLKQLLAMGMNGCPWPEKRQACAEAYRELCQRGHVLGSTVSITVRAGEDQAYAVQNHLADTTILSAVYVQDAAGRDLPRRVWTIRQSPGRIHVLLMAAPVQPGDVVSIRLVHVPTLSRADDRPDMDVLTDYAEAIVCGARSRLLLMDGEPWANPALGVYERRQFERHIGQARSRVETEGTFLSGGLRA